MKAIKKAVYPMQKCYSIAQIQHNDKPYIAVAAEKEDDCLLFTPEGKFVETIWKGPSGTMSIVPLQGENGAFLATKKMFSPNNADEACIVLVRPTAQGWKEKTLIKIPYAHRFDVLESDGKRYLVCATIKKTKEYEDDWRFPGQYLACELPPEPENADLKLQVIVDGLLKNHGYIRRHDKNGDYSVISSATGIFEIHPPTDKNSEWSVEKLLDEETSDMAFADFDGDGQDEMVTLSPFHGNTVKFFKKQDAGCSWKCVYEFPKKLEFVHAIWAGTVKGKQVAVIGHRKGESRDLYVFSYDNGYRAEVLDKDCGSTNVLVYNFMGKDRIVSANREINEIAFYEFEE
ncbi:hypothetical protein [Treponema parvum]|uniref:hypothetical protein n=1 Tax=Treponema parvum TaxID=138851 RepID=UPI001AEC454B|nr:hypothetical protein [Treponema parvum]QTQ16831.1 hypothetical protein HXT04_09065 [Treponema parvum]